MISAILCSPLIYKNPSLLGNIVIGTTGASHPDYNNGKAYIEQGGRTCNRDCTPPAADSAHQNRQMGCSFVFVSSRGSGIVVKIYNLSNNSPQSTQRAQSYGNNVFADFAIFAVKLKES
jgi:hypothetical protein